MFTRRFGIFSILLICLLALNPYLTAADKEQTTDSNDDDTTEVNDVNEAVKVAKVESKPVDAATTDSRDGKEPEIVKCYQCDYTDDDCDDPFDKEENEEETDRCANKTCYKASIKGSAKVYRGCLGTEPDEKCQDGTWEGQDATICYCDDEDLCNTAADNYNVKFVTILFSLAATITVFSLTNAFA